MDQSENIFNSKEFKALPKWNRMWIRIRIAFLETISML